MWLSRLTTLLLTCSGRRCACVIDRELKESFGESAVIGMNSAALILTEVLISLARLAYFSVLRVSSYILDEGLTLAIITVLQLPPKESLSIRVSLLSLYGIKAFFF